MVNLLHSGRRVGDYLLPEQRAGRRGVGFISHLRPLNDFTPGYASLVREVARVGTRAAPLYAVEYSPKKVTPTLRWHAFQRVPGEGSSGLLLGSGDQPNALVITSPLSGVGPCPASMMLRSSCSNRGFGIRGGASEGVQRPRGNVGPPARQGRRDHQVIMLADALVAVVPACAGPRAREAVFSNSFAIGNPVLAPSASRRDLTQAQRSPRHPPSTP